MVRGVVANRASDLAALRAEPHEADAARRLALLLEGMALRALKQLYPAMDLRTAQQGLAALGPSA